MRCEGVGSSFVAIGADDGRRGVHFQFPLREDVAKFLPSIVVRKSVDCRKICTVAAMVEYRQGAESMQWSLT